MKAKIAITGAYGTVGTVMRNALRDYDIVPIDLPDIDVTDYNAVLKAVKGCSAVIHLAWNLKVETPDTGKISPDNDIMTYNVYEACVKAGVPRVVAASSVHADYFLEYNGRTPLNTTTVPTPTSPYGANKVFLEALGRFYAKHEGLEVVCVRFGSVSKRDVPGTTPWDWRKVWLSHRDLGSMIRHCLVARRIPDNYAVFYAVSNNAKRIHDWSNPVGWVPVDDAYAPKN